MVDNYIQIKTVGDLKKAIENIDDNELVYFFTNDLIFDLEIELGSRISNEHNGKSWEAKGLIFEVDG